MRLFEAIIDANHRAIANRRPFITVVSLKQVSIEPKRLAKDRIRLDFEENGLKMVKMKLAMATNMKAKTAFALTEVAFALIKAGFVSAKAGFASTESTFVLTKPALVMTKAFAMMTKATKALTKAGIVSANQPTVTDALGLV